MLIVKYIRTNYNYLLYSYSLLLILLFYEYDAFILYKYFNKNNI
jgi:hypothetical protein